MEIIKSGNEEILKFLGTPERKKDCKYRLCKYVLTESVNADIIAVFSTLTNFTVYLSNNEFKYITELTDFDDILIRNYIVVEEDFDEYSKVEEYRAFKVSKIDDDYLSKISIFTILTTTDCNARCFYCYEKGCAKIKMSDKTAEEVADFIIKHKAEGIVSLRWFGGEPTYNSRVVDIICEILTKNNIEFESDITSNGILLNEDTVKHAVKDWHLKTVQISLDGTEEKYNKVKNYIYKEIESPFNDVISNIGYLADNGVRVSVRLNADLYNIDDLKELITFLHKKFKNHDLVNVYSHVLFDPDKKRSLEKRREVYDRFEEIQELLYDLGYLSKEPVGNIMYHHCMVDSGESLLISPLGKVGLCEHFVGEDFFSDIHDYDNKDWEKIHNWRKRIIYKECESCPLFPTCMKISQCVDGSECNSDIQAMNLRSASRQMKNLIKNVMKMSAPVPYSKYKGLVDDFSRLFERVNYLEKKLNELTSEKK